MNDKVHNEKAMSGGDGGRAFKGDASSGPGCVVKEAAAGSLASDPLLDVVAGDSAGSYKITVQDPDSGYHYHWLGALCFQRYPHIGRVILPLTLGSLFTLLCLLTWGVSHIPIHFVRNAPVWSVPNVITIWTIVFLCGPAHLMDRWGTNMMRGVKGVPPTLHALRIGRRIITVCILIGGGGYGVANGMVMSGVWQICGVQGKVVYGIISGLLTVTNTLLAGDWLLITWCGEQFYKAILW